MSVTAAPRAFPLQSVTDTLSITINGGTTTINSRNVLSATQRFISKDYLEDASTECPSMPDNRTLLLADSNATAAAVAGDASAIQSVSNQPLSSYDNSLGYTRGSFIPKSYVNAANVSTWIFEISEPVMISPLSLFDNDVALGNLSNMSMQFNYSSLADMFVSSKPYNALTSITISEPKLQLSILAVNNDIVTIPKAIKYDYQNIVYFPQTVAWENGAGNSGVQQVQTQLIRLQTMPKMLYVFARNPIQSRAGGTAADCFYSIGMDSGSAGVSIQLGTRTGLLASMSTKTMFKMAKDNGYNSTRSDYAFGSGGILCIDPVKNLGVSLQNDSLPGEISGNVNLQMNVTFNTRNFAYAGNLASVQANLEVMVIAVYAGDVTLTSDQALFSLGTLSKTEVDSLITHNTSYVASETVAPTVPKGAGLFAKGRTLVGHGQRK